MFQAMQAAARGRFGRRVKMTARIRLRSRRQVGNE